MAIRHLGCSTSTCTWGPTHAADGRTQACTFGSISFHMPRPGTCRRPSGSVRPQAFVDTFASAQRHSSMGWGRESH